MPGEGTLASGGTVTMFASDGLTVWAELNAAGDLVIQGQDLSGHPFAREYEYALTVPAAHVGVVAQALGGRAPTDVLELLKANGERIVKMGERTWLQSLGVEVRTWNRIEPFDMD